MQFRVRALVILLVDGVQTAVEPKAGMCIPVPVRSPSGAGQTAAVGRNHTANHANSTSMSLFKNNRFRQAAEELCNIRVATIGRRLRAGYRQPAAGGKSRLEGF